MFKSDTKIDSINKEPKQTVELTPEETQAIQQLDQELKQLKDSFSMIKDTIRDGMDESVVMQKSREIKDKIKERVNNDVLTFMKL